MGARISLVLLAGLYLAHAAGCRHAKPELPSDPILVSKTPALAKAKHNPPCQLVSYVEPQTPTGPLSAMPTIIAATHVETTVASIRE